ncbi:MAG: hypothetical protein KC431_25875 [Myxococcales bacterium]|nr:hypothetical protein [Myxococcales bacterium]
MPKHARPSWMALLAASWLVSACPAPEPNDGDGNGDEGTTGDSTGDTGTDTDTGVTWDDVPCGANTCASPAICVKPGVNCNYAPCEQGMQAEWIYYDPYCAFIPEACDINDNVCIEEMLCVVQSGNFSNGTLNCYPVARDCFC